MPLRNYEKPVIENKTKSLKKCDRFLKPFHYLLLR